MTGSRPKEQHARLRRNVAAIPEGGRHETYSAVAHAGDEVLGARRDSLRQVLSPAEGRLVSAVERPLARVGPTHLSRLRTVLQIVALMGRLSVYLPQMRPHPSRIPRGHPLMEPQGVFRKRGGLMALRRMHGLWAENYARTNSTEGPPSIRTACETRSSAGESACQLEFHAALG